jgi:DNA-binding NarL/FixJ family response regulator
MSVTLVRDARPLFAEALALSLRSLGLDDVRGVTDLSAIHEALAVGTTTTVVLSLAPGEVLGRELEDLCRQVRVVVLTGAPDAELGWAALDAGAAAVASRTRPLEELAAVIAGRADLDADATCQDRPAGGHPAAAYERFLTPRQAEVLDLLVLARSTEQIAERLGITSATARGYVQTVLEKLGVHSRLEAVALAGKPRADQARRSWVG